MFGNAHAWRSQRRLALFDWHTKPKDNLAIEQLHQYLTMGHHRCVIVMAPPPVGGGDEAGKSGNASWRALKAPDNAKDMQYSFWEPPQYPGLTVIPVPYVWKRMKKIQEFLMQRTVLWARRGLVTPPFVGVYGYDYGAMEETLDALRDRPLSVDIEAISSMGIIMAIGLSDGERSISVPFDAYPVYTGTNQTGTEPPLTHRVIRDKVLALLGANTPKIFHNASFDVPFLRGRNIPVNGNIHDTWAAHVVLFPGVAHGLQQACSMLYPCPPWKSIAKAQWASRGVTPEDPKYWLKTGIELRKYNAQDAYYTALLAKRLLPSLNINV
jgi:hypothetical protein